MIRDFVPTHVMNAQDKPRILVYVHANRTQEFSWVQSLPGSCKFIQSFDFIDPLEWDAVVTTYSMTSTPVPPILPQWRDYAKNIVPPHLMTFYVLPKTRQNVIDPFVELGANLNGTEMSEHGFLYRAGVPGNEVRRVEHVPEVIQDLVKSSLVPIATSRFRQFGFDAPPVSALGGLKFKKVRPFLIGPQDLILAGSYERHDGVSVWVVPEDVPNLKSWFDAALTEWHVARPKDFPGVSAWQTSPDWHTSHQREISDALQSAKDELVEAEIKYAQISSSLREEFERVSLEATKGRRRLLVGQDQPLQDAVKEALQDIGFLVQDMDLVWDERHRREDFRISDPDDASWLVIADSTGVATGAKASKLLTLAGFVTKYLVENKPSNTPRQWLIVNRLLNRDPNLRGEIFREDELRVFMDNEGLAIDTPALYLLAESCSGIEIRRTAVRKWIRSLRGQLTVAMARKWLGEQEFV